MNEKRIVHTIDSECSKISRIGSRIHAYKGLWIYPMAVSPSGLSCSNSVACATLGDVPVANNSMLVVSGAGTWVLTLEREPSSASDITGKSPCSTVPSALGKGREGLEHKWREAGGS